MAPVSSMPDAGWLACLRLLRSAASMPMMVLKGLAETFSSISVSESALDMVDSLAELIEWLGDNSYKRPCRHRNPFCVDQPISTDHITLLPIHAQIEHPPFYSAMYFT